MLIFYIHLTKKLATLANGLRDNRGSFDDGKKSFKNVTRTESDRFETVLLKSLVFILPHQ